ncbi:uroplakin-3b-like [Amia ocellicauda]|uniref:uroplakin-3b-like n=1 Tax=Amia ocellicauda TaxID=2972642 RepID=UPI003463BAF9
MWLSMSIPSVNYTPEVTTYNLTGRVTATTLLLNQPLCFFDNLKGLPCTTDTCEIWLSVARGAGVQNFDVDMVSFGSAILSTSPYPSAFISEQNKSYYITRLGIQNRFPCAKLPGIRYFRVGDEGNCTTTNCNGVLPVGSTVRVKYLLVDPVSRRVSYESMWSQPISLITPKPSASIDEWIGKRSGGMVVVTAIASCLLALLLLLVIGNLLREWENKEEL